MTILYAEDDSMTVMEVQEKLDNLYEEWEALASD